MRDIDRVIKVEFTQDEANAAFTQLIARLDDFDDYIKAEGKKERPSADRLIELANAKKKMENAKEKLFNAGATFWC